MTVNIAFHELKTLRFSQSTTFATFYFYEEGNVGWVRTLPTLNLKLIFWQNYILRQACYTDIIR